MPEGHLIHHHARRHRDGLLGAAVISSPQGKLDVSPVQGRLTDVEAYGKHLFHRWSGGAVVHVHLGLRGIFLDARPPVPPPRPQVRMRVEGPRLVSDLIAPLLCEVTDETGRRGIVDRLGPDPLREDADRNAALVALASTGRPIGAALLDQALIAGVGNALRADVLNLAGIHPLVPADTIGDEGLLRLWETLTDLMQRSAAAGTIPHTVYRREDCSRCHAAVVTLEVGGRTTYVCPTHQGNGP